jgi:hypothetical protein
MPKQYVARHIIKEEAGAKMKSRTYIALDLKSFYASVECVERGLDPLTTNLVVADESRTEKTICLAVSPSLKAYGISGRARLFEVVQRVKEVNAVRQRKAPGRTFSGASVSDIELKSSPELSVDYITAPPRMAHYIEYSTQIYNVYLKYIAPEDIHVYSIDEVFIDATHYLNTYKLSARELAAKMILDVLETTGITAAAGIGTNLYLAKIAMDIRAKHIPADQNGAKIAELDEMSYRRFLWSHRPLTDFWRVGKGYAKRLEEQGLFTMGDNSLYTTDGQGLWTNASAVGSSSRATFYDIINKGYGVGIAYTETKPDFSPTLNVRICEAWPGSAGSRNSNHYGISNGSAFSNYTYGNGYPILGDRVWFALHFPAESENCYVRQTVWVVGGGSTSRNVWSNSNTWYDVALSPTTVDSGRSSYTVKARADWIDSSGNVRKWGAEKTFYIPVRPKINRYQVSMYSVSGALSAYKGDGGSSGVVYAGQRVYPYYTFTSNNSWTSYNNFSANLYAWINGSWQRAYGTSDMTATGVGISQSSSYNRYSSLYPYRVPDNSTNTGGSNRIPIDLTSAWYSDTGRTYESTWIDIPIVKADVELTQIRLIGDSGYYLDPQNLEAGQNVTVQYTYRNNTSCTVYINGYKNDRTQIPGIYAIPAYGTINVNGYSFEVPNQRSISIWGGVYLEGLGIYHTGYETNGTNNSLTLTCNVNHPLRLSPITPNATYREATSVITSYWLTNEYRDSYTPASNITVRFRAYRSNGTLITTVTKTQAVVPGNDMNLIYFKWNVPTGLNYGNVIVMADVLQNGVYYNLVSRSYATMPYYYYETPDTQFETNAPAGFSIPTAPTNQTGYATWWEYTYNGSSFVRNYYGIGVYSGGTNSVTPATGATATQNGSTWVMKSGYGISLQAYNALTTVSGYQTPYSTAYTSAQYGYAVFPEYGYASTISRYRTLERISSNQRNW